MPFPEYSFRSQEWRAYLIQIRESIESGTAMDVTLSRDLSQTVQTSIQDLRCDLNSALTLIADMLEQQSGLLENILADVKAIRRSSEFRLLTRARELYLMGLDRFKRELYGKALHLFLKAEKSNDVDYPLQLQIGLSYLFGCSKEENIIDPAKAEEHFLLAVKYAKAYQDCLPQWHVCVGLAYFHASRAAYVQAKEQKTGGRQRVLFHLGRALSHANEGVQIWQECCEGRYLRAKILCLMGKRHDALEEMKFVVDRDRRYLRKADADEDFNSARHTLADLPKYILQSPGPVSRQAYVLLQTITRVTVSVKETFKGHNLQQINAVEERITNATTALARMDTDMAHLLRGIQETRQNLIQLVDQLVQSQIDVLQEKNLQKYHRVEEIGRTKSEYTGTGLGCLFAILLVIGIPTIAVTLSVFLMVLGVPIGTIQSIFPALYIVFSLIGLGLFMLAHQMDLRKHNFYWDAEIMLLQQAIAEHDELITAWRSWLQQLY